LYAWAGRAEQGEVPCDMCTAYKEEDDMKIKIDENIVEFRPEGDAEQKDLESL
jgi:hypothetical protein